MTVVAIDPAYSKAFAYAIFRNNKLMFFGKDEYLSTIVNILVKRRPDIVVTEDMYLGKSVDTLKKLCYAVGKIMYICEKIGTPYRLISPREWTLHHGLRGIKSRDLRRQLEDKIIETVMDHAPRDEDIRSAILIGMCHIEQTKMGVE